MPKPPIVPVPHDPDWARAFEDARAALMAACGGYVLEVHHVGSTAIPGIAARPVTAIMPLLRRHPEGLARVLRWQRERTRQRLRQTMAKLTGWNR